MNSHGDGGVEHISECFIKPKYEVEEAKQPYYLSPWDLVHLGTNYNQKGLLFMKPNIDKQGLFSIESLKESLSLTLVHFYPLAGQLATVVDHDRHGSRVFVDCNKGPGVRFVHATCNVHVSDLSLFKFKWCLFDHRNWELNYDGHTRPLLSVQVTELVDGILIGCSINHAIVDGTSFWHFWNIWSEIHETGGSSLSISCPPYHRRWVPEGYDPADIFLPYVHPDEFIHRYIPPSEEVLRTRFFHFSSENVSILKAKVNQELNSHNGPKVKVSSFQALIALVWRSMIRAKGSPHREFTRCCLTANNRSRVDPPLPQEYFGNSVSPVYATALVGELLQHEIGWAALLLNQSVANHTEEAVRSFFRQWFESPYVLNHRMWREANNHLVLVGSSPRFRVYENRFAGLGKPVAVCTGDGNKFSGKVNAFPSYEGGGSVDLEIFLPHDSMTALELDQEFMAYVSPTGNVHSEEVLAEGPY